MFTTDKIYELLCGTHIVNDLEEISKPYLKGNNYWIEHTCEEETKLYENVMGIKIKKSGNKVVCYGEIPLGGLFKTNENVCMKTDRMYGNVFLFIILETGRLYSGLEDNDHVIPVISVNELEVEEI